MPTNWLSRRPLASSSGKNFRLVSIVATSASCGTARKPSSKPHSTALGHSTRQLTCSMLPDFALDALAAFVGIDQHLRAAQDIDVGCGRVDPHRLVVQEAMAAAVAT